MFNSAQIFSGEQEIIRCRGPGSLAVWTLSEPWRGKSLHKRWSGAQQLIMRAWICSWPAPRQADKRPLFSLEKLWLPTHRIFSTGF